VRAAGNRRWIAAAGGEVHASFALGFDV